MTRIFAILALLAVTPALAGNLPTGDCLQWPSTKSDGSLADNGKPCTSMAGDISKPGDAIEVENYRCEVTSSRAISCQNIGRVCQELNAKEKIEHDKTFGCATHKPNDCPPWPDYESDAMKAHIQELSYCMKTIYGAF
jgi:hypothetical protein